MKNFRNFTTKKLVVIAIVAIIATVIEAKFIATSVIYANYSMKLHFIEKDANAGIWTSNGYQYWTDTQVQDYNETLEEKSNFIENSDFAMYLYHAGFSVTGKVFRIIAIAVVLYLILFTLNVLSVTLKILCRRFKRYVKRLKRFYSKRKNNNNNKLQKNQG